MMGTIRTLWPAVRLIVALLLFGWPIASDAELVDRIVAIVNEDAITLSELEEAIKPFVQQIHSGTYSPEEKRQLAFKVRQDMLNRMIDRKLTEQEGKRLGVTVQESEVDKRLERIKSENFFTQENLIKALKAEGFTVDEYRNKIRDQLLSMKLVTMEVKSKIAITDDAIQQYYNEHKKNFENKQQYHLRTILVRVSSWKNAKEKQKALDRMDIVVEALNAGTPFEEVAKQYSEDPTAKSGGDLGMLSIDELASELRETVRWMEKGQVSSVLQTSLGYQLLMVEEALSSSGKTLEEAKGEIQELIYRETAEEKYKAWLEALWERSFIKVIQ